MKTRSQPRPRKQGNPDLRRQHQTPAPAIPQLVEELKDYLQPSLFTPLKYFPGNHDRLMRERTLTLPVMVALVLSIVMRQIAGLSEAVRVLKEEGLLWVEPLKVSKQALSTRLMTFPAAIFAALLNQVLERQRTRALPIALSELGQSITNRVERILSEGPLYRDEIIHLGQYRSNPSNSPVRLVSVLWGKTWYRYLTNVLDTEQLSAREVCDLYRRRWQVEEAFLLTKRLLGLAYLWVGHTNGVQIQIVATLIFYTVLNQLVGEVAVALNQPKEKISVEMVFRSLYYVAKAIVRGENPDVVLYLAERAKLFGLVKAERKRERERDEISRLIWETVSLS